jgi:hypothetical protein
MCWDLRLVRLLKQRTPISSNSMSYCNSLQCCLISMLSALSSPKRLLWLLIHAQATDAVYVALGRVLTISGRTIRPEAQVRRSAL